MIFNFTIYLCVAICRYGMVGDRTKVSVPPPTPARRRKSTPINRQNLQSSRNLNLRRINQQNFNIKKTIFKVDMSCNGCSNAIKRILRKINGLNL